MSTRDFNFSEPAELYFSGASRWGRTAGVTYRKFDAAAEAVRYAVETLAGNSRRTCVLEVNEARFNHGEIRKLYDSGDYPLPRQTGKDADGTQA